MTEQVMLKSSLFNPLLGDNEEGYSLHIPTTSGWQTPDAYSGVNWIFPDSSLLRKHILSHPTIYHIGHLIEDCYIFVEDPSQPKLDKDGKPKKPPSFHTYLSPQSSYLRQIRTITRRESDKGNVILYQKKIRRGNEKPIVSAKPSMKASQVKKRSQTKPIFEYHSHPVKKEPSK